MVVLRGLVMKMTYGGCKYDNTESESVLNRSLDFCKRCDGCGTETHNVQIYKAEPIPNGGKGYWARSPTRYVVETGIWITLHQKGTVDDVFHQIRGSSLPIKKYEGGDDLGLYGITLLARGQSERTYSDATRKWGHVCESERDRSLSHFLPKGYWLDASSKIAHSKSAMIDDLLEELSQSGKHPSGIDFKDMSGYWYLSKELYTRLYLPKIANKLGWEIDEWLGKIESSPPSDLALDDLIAENLGISKTVMPVTLIGRIGIHA